MVMGVAIFCQCLPYRTLEARARRCMIQAFRVVRQVNILPEDHPKDMLHLQPPVTLTGCRSQEKENLQVHLAYYQHRLNIRRPPSGAW